MTVVAGLTGGIGSGKSTVANLLAERGAAVVDADEIAHAVAAPGGPAYGAIVARFGEGIVARDGSIDRAALAHVVFADASARRDLEVIVHPVVRRAIADRLGALRNRPPDAGVVVVVIPLLGEAHVSELGLDAVVVVDCAPEVALARLVDVRGMDEADARARMAAQPGREERLSLADYVVENSTTPSDLDVRVDALWRWLTTFSA